MSTVAHTPYSQWLAPSNSGSETIELATQIPLPPSSSILRAPSLATFSSAETESQSSAGVDARSARNEVALAPVDGGLGAWLFVRY